MAEPELLHKKMTNVGSFKIQQEVNYIKLIQFFVCARCVKC